MEELMRVWPVSERKDKLEGKEFGKPKNIMQRTFYVDTYAVTVGFFC